MNRILIIVFLLVVISFLLGFILSIITSPTVTIQKGGITDFSVETRAVCEELRNSTCYYKCHDEVFLRIAGKEMSVYKNSEYVCHGESWVDPRQLT